MPGRLRAGESELRPSRALRALIVEDSEEDEALLLRELRRGGYDVAWKRVDTPEGMEFALKAEPWDIVFCDYSMPRFSAPEAFAILRERGQDLPFIIVSGTVGEETAVAAMKSGVHDYIIKGKLARLVPAVERELREAEVRGERARMHEQLLISDRMVAMGALAAGVAHEINNPLASVMANIELASRTLRVLSDTGPQITELDEVREELADALEGVERIRTIVRDLKIFSRSDEDKRGPVDLRRVMDSTARMAWNEIRHRARLVKNYEPVPLVLANESRLGQVFLNLIMNAAQAITEGRAEANEIRLNVRMHGSSQVCVEVVDTGEGMPPEVVERLFTPFFTTKPPGVGTGLGLSICQRIVTGLGGTISVFSEVGKGTTFRVLIPASRPGEVVTPASAPQVSEMPAHRRGRVLVVDDEAMIIRAVQRTLAPDHDVVACMSANDALARLRSGERYDVILCDVMMPQMTGLDLHRELVAFAPDQAERMVFVTGGAFTAHAHSALDSMTNLRVEKPFDAANLRSIVNERVK